MRDPQQRIFLELAHTALSDAGYDPARYDGDIGVYGGIGADEYQWNNIRRNPAVMAGAGLLASRHRQPLRLPGHPRPRTS